MSFSGFILASLIFSPLLIYAAYTEECNPIVRIEKIIDCENPHKKCLVQFKVKCDAYPDWMNCKLQEGDSIESHISGLEKRPSVGSKWTLKYSLYCAQPMANCNLDMWTAMGPGQCPARKTK